MQELATGDTQASLYITYHRPSHVVADGRALIPIQVGSGSSIPGINCRDNTGKNIAERNPSYCELTALYWIWRSAPESASHLGLLHYRRFLDFASVLSSKGKQSPELDSWGVINELAFSHDFQDRYGLNQATINRLCAQADLILPRAWSVREAGFHTLREHYEHSPHHHAADLAACEAVLLARRPELTDSWRRVMASDQGYFNNMFVLRRDLFDHYCAWLFPLLCEIEPLIPLDRYDIQAKRVMGYLSERLFNVWLDALRQAQPQLRCLELDRVFVQDTTAKRWDPPMPAGVPGAQVVSVVIASDDHYTPHLGALIVSILDHLAADRFLDLLVLDGGISGLNRSLLQRLMAGRGQLHFVPMQDEFQNYFVHMHFSRTTFYRLVLENLLPSRSRVLYVDCDTIVLADLAELWDLDLQGRPMAAAPDLIMEHFCRSNVLSADFNGSLPAAGYLRRFLSIDPELPNCYFQAGVLVMDLDAMRALACGPRMVEDLTQQRYWFLDQDVLNKYFSKNYLPLCNSWNYVNCEQDIVDSLSDRGRARLDQAAQSIKIIHYAGYEAKPWVNRHAWLAPYYFHYLRRTYWYEQVMETLGPGVPAVVQASRPSLRAYGVASLRRGWRRLPHPVRRALNPLAYRLIRRVRRVG